MMCVGQWYQKKMERGGWAQRSEREWEKPLRNQKRNETWQEERGSLFFREKGPGATEGEKRG